MPFGEKEVSLFKTFLLLIGLIKPTVVLIDQLTYHKSFEVDLLIGCSSLIHYSDRVD